jgi:16S rRNA (cytosine967-C5)-methyltransferase
MLKSANINCSSSEVVASGITLETPCSVEKLPGFNDGLVSIQDIAPQLAAGLLDLKNGLHVLDACAAPGGKTAHILESSAGKLELTALEIDPLRLQRISQNIQRLGHEVEVIEGDARNPGAWWSGQKYDRILLDAPCSGSGVIRRHPDIKLLRRATDIEQLATQQHELLQSLWPLLNIGGKLLYATCSILPQEKIQILPGEHNMDGFFYACLQKN